VSLHLDNQNSRPFRRYNPSDVLLYYITDRKSFAGTEVERQSALLRRIAEAACAGVNYIQLREKDLPARELEHLARAALRAVRESSEQTKLLINARTDIALACGADGVHLPAGELPASQVRALWSKCGGPTPIIGISAHSTADVHEAMQEGADFAVLAPIFEKPNSDAKAIGLDALSEASSLIQTTVSSSRPFALLALGGINLTNAAACINAGASGVAGIRLFQTGSIRETVRSLHNL
jgi:thiamine-phosphate pyrophosphorylase